MQAPVTRERGKMTALSLEVFGKLNSYSSHNVTAINIGAAPSSGRGMPDPDKDQIVAAFYSFYDSNFQRVDHDAPFKCESGVIALNDVQLHHSRLRNWDIDTVDTELELLNRVVDIVHDFDPDIITGWEVQVSSWGYLAARARSFGSSAASCLFTGG